MFTKHFWKSYIGDTPRLKFVGSFGLLIAIVIALFSVPCALAMICGYILNDPLSYYMFGYKK